MTEMPDRYHRSMLLFGAAGQKQLRATSVLVVGSGGLGSPLVQHLALLGVRRVTVADHDQLDDTNRNRFVGARHTDPVPGSWKVNLVARMVQEINPNVEAVPLPFGLVSEPVFAAARKSDWVFGCFDKDGPRAILNEVCAVYEKSYIDLASDVPEAGVYGGQVCVSVDGNGCLHCLGLLDQRDVRRYLESPERLAEENRIYGIPQGALDKKGPSVSPVNGVVASLAATEFMAAVTGLRPPTRLQIYRGWESKVLVSADIPKPGCHYCKSIRRKPQEADVERYLRLPRFNAEL